MDSFWNKLPRPFLVMAPLANVTDAAFRRLFAKYSKPFGPAVMYTEFVSADGLMRASAEGKAKLMRDLLYTEAERPIVAQLFCARPEMMEGAARLAAELGFDGVDINMGCPDKAIERQGAGAALIRTPEIAADVIAAAKQGIESAGKNIPVSVKTRLGYNKDVLEEWLPALLAAEPAVVTLHARTRKEMSKVPARWERVKRAIEIRNELGSSTLIVGNGDAADPTDAYRKAAESGADGVMLGRALFGKPWLFAAPTHTAETVRDFAAAKSLNSGVVTPLSPPLPYALELSQRLRIAVEHAKLFEELLGDIKSFAIMKKHFKAYAEGFDGSKELRIQLMETNNAAEVEEVIERFLAEKTAPFN
jgi:tRNA-dihydrouridine synthase